MMTTQAFVILACIIIAAVCVLFFLSLAAVKG